MSVKDKDRRIISWVSFIWLVTAPIQAMLIGSTDVLIFVIPSLVSIIIANWFSSPKGDVL